MQLHIAKVWFEVRSSNWKLAEFQAHELDEAMEGTETLREVKNNVDEGRTRWLIWELFNAPNLLVASDLRFHYSLCAVNKRFRHIVALSLLLYYLPAVVMVGWLHADGDHHPTSSIAFAAGQDDGSPPLYHSQLCQACKFLTAHWFVPSNPVPFTSVTFSHIDSQVLTLQRYPLSVAVPRAPPAA